MARMSGTLQIPKWAITVGAFLLTLGSLGAGVVSAGWAARGVLEEQTQAITSLRQTINETVRPAMAKIETQTAQLASHDTQLAVHNTRLAVIESACCEQRPNSLPKQQAPGPIGDARAGQPAIAPMAPRLRHEEGVL
jgi:hypothetical protein